MQFSKPPSTRPRAAEGVEHLPDQLLGLGLAERIHARHAERRGWPPECQGNAAWSPKLAGAVEVVLAAGELGGGVISE